MSYLKMIITPRTVWFNVDSIEETIKHLDDNSTAAVNSKKLHKIALITKNDDGTFSCSFKDHEEETVTEVLYPTGIESVVYSTKKPELTRVK